MNRPKWNYAVDWIAFLLITPLLATGLLLHFRLPPGSGASSVLGLTRHEWGEVHFWIAVALSAMVTVHLLLHAAWIKSLTVARTTGTARRVRAWGAIAAATMVAAGVATLMLWPVHRTTGGEQHGNRTVETEHNFEHGTGAGRDGTGRQGGGGGMGRRRAAESINP